MPRYERHHFDEFPEAADCKEAIQQERYKNMDLMGRLNTALAAKFRNNPLAAASIYTMKYGRSLMPASYQGE